MSLAQSSQDCVSKNLTPDLVRVCRIDATLCFYSFLSSRPNSCLIAIKASRAIGVYLNDDKGIDMNIRKFRNGLWSRAAALVGLLACGATQVYASTIYSQDPTLSDFTNTITEYGTFTSGLLNGPSGNQTLSNSSTYQPSTSTLLASGYPRVIGYGNSPINVSFSAATSNIVVFDNIDHLGYAWDVFQYKILGSNDGVNYSALFDPISVNEPNQPNTNASFTLNTFTGTAPTLLNNTLTPGQGGYQGNVGYEEYFTFGGSYQYFQFLPSTLTTAPGGENELELSAVGIATPSNTIVATAAEPESLALLGLGLFGLGFSRRKKA